MAGPTRLRRDAGVIGLLYASLGSIIGSGWLFGALHAALQAGPLSVFSWIGGAIAILLVAFVFAELSTMFPNSGALVHMTHVSHGDFLGKIWSWILFLGFVSIPPVEVIAVLTYANSYFPGLIDTATGLLTAEGYVAAAILLAFIIALNFLAVRWVMAINSTATWWKLLIPMATIPILLIYSFHPENMVAQVDSVPISGIFTAIATAGVAFSYLGFQQAIALAGETRNPGRNVPIALIGSVLIGAVVYIGLQIAFIMALSPEDMAGGWTNLHFEGMFGPLAAIAVAVGAFWWAIILYIDAVISPLGTGFIYATASPRITMAAGEMGNAPKVVTRLNRHGVPWVGLIIAYVVGLLFFFPFPSWQKLVSAVVMITVLSYSVGPILIISLRKSLPGAERPFRLRALRTLALLAFISANWLIYWTGYETIVWLLSFVGVYVVFYLSWTFIGYLRGRCSAVLPQGWRHTLWIVPYLAGLWLISYLGPDGVACYGFFVGMAILAGFSPVILWLGVRSRQDDDSARKDNEFVGSLGSRGSISEQEDEVIRSAEETAP
ncbi:MAG: APC family permease [Gammaproteobacteria bacterium]|nr:APC family permease [Gammaproteobacteria bacterium]